MCITAVIAGASLLLSATGTYATIQANNAQADYAKWEAKQRTKELKINTELAKISAMERENERAREFNRSWSSSLAAIGAMGVAEHISFFQGIGPDSLNQLDSDVRAIRLGLVHEEAGMHRQIRVIGYGARVAKFNAKTQNIGAVAGFMQDAMSAYSFYNKYNTPSGGAGGG